MAAPRAPATSLLLLLLLTILAATASAQQLALSRPEGDCLAPALTSLTSSYNFFPSTYQLQSIQAANPGASSTGLETKVCSVVGVFLSAGRQAASLHVDCFTTHEVSGHSRRGAHTHMHCLTVTSSVALQLHCRWSLPRTSASPTMAHTRQVSKHPVTAAKQLRLQLPLGRAASCVLPAVTVPPAHTLKPPCPPACLSTLQQKPFAKNTDCQQLACRGAVPALPVRHTQPPDRQHRARPATWHKGL
jgi:hypothetical protein